MKGNDIDMPAMFGGRTAAVGYTIHWLVVAGAAVAAAAAMVGNYYFYGSVKYTMTEYTLLMY